VLPQDMVAIRLGQDGRFVAIASPGYLAAHGTPQTPDDLAHHACIKFRLPSGKIYAWELERDGQAISVEVDGPVTLDSMDLMARAATDGLGIAFIWMDVAREALRRGDVQLVLEDWTPSFPGFFLYYPGHRLVPAALRAFIDVLKDIDFSDPE
jgi:DNA-binding transcriptional LysR family regulator